MESRREFLTKIGGVVLLLPVGWTVVQSAGCGGAPTSSPDELTFTSTSVDAHTHSFKLTVTELENPPTGGITRDTSVGGGAYSGHEHELILTEADITNINGGTSVTKRTSETDSHAHDFTFSKA